MNRHLLTSLPRHRRRHAASLAGLLGAALPACVDAEPRDLGYTQAADELSLDEPATPFFTSPSEFVGRWLGRATEPLAFSANGEASSYEFPSGSTQIVVDVQVDADGNLLGQITFGAGAPLPLATDPDTSYPPGVDIQGLLSYPVPGAGIPSLQTDANLPPFEGFAYGAGLGSTLDGNVPDGVLTLGFNVNQPLDAWCALQTPYPRESGFACVPSVGGQFEVGPGGTDALCKIYGQPGPGCFAEPPELEACEDGVLAEVDCDKLFACEAQLCACDESSCRAKPSSWACSRTRASKIAAASMYRSEKLAFSSRSE